jgi:SAM-dependent methyltransferase
VVRRRAAQRARAGSIRRRDYRWRRAHKPDLSCAKERDAAGSYRLDLLLRHLRPVRKPGVHLLDIGSGPGYLLADLSRRFPDAELRGIELSETAIERARVRAPRAEFLQCDLLASVEPPASWLSWADVAICSEVLEHVDSPGLVLENVQRLMPGGQLIVTVPGGPRSAFDHHIGHRRHYSRADLRSLLVESGFSVERCDAEGFPFFNLYRMMVVARGDRLVEDAKTARTTEGLPARVIGALFRMLFRLNLRTTPWGWQLVAEATLDRGRSSRDLTEAETESGLPGRGSR